jgi:tetratricopeptide (TPR) repeat protein
MTRPKTDADMALELARLAQLFLSYGKHNAADKLLNAALELEPNNPAVTRVRAFTAYKCGRFAEAAALARQARAAGGSRPAADRSVAGNATSTNLATMGLSLVEAFSLMSLGRTKEAGEQYASLAVPNPDAPDASTSADAPAPHGRPAGRMNSE